MDIVLWVVFPYVCLTVFVVGHFWRYRYDKFGWTTRSSQLYESRLLRIGSPLFHFGMLVVIVGHIIGLVIPESWTRAIMSDHVYHLQAGILGGIAGIATLAGIALLVYRRRTKGPARQGAGRGPRPFDTDVRRVRIATRCVTYRDVVPFVATSPRSRWTQPWSTPICPSPTSGRRLRPRPRQACPRDRFVTGTTG